VGFWAVVCRVKSFTIPRRQNCMKSWRAIRALLQLYHDWRMKAYTYRWLWRGSFRVLCGAEIPAKGITKAYKGNSTRMAHLTGALQRIHIHLHPIFSHAIAFSKSPSHFSVKVKFSPRNHIYAKALTFFPQNVLSIFCPACLSVWRGLSSTVAKVMQNDAATPKRNSIWSLRLNMIKS
jgi:hypothetical protein